MRTRLITLGGFLRWGACLGTTTLLAPTRGVNLGAASDGCIALWFALAATNFWAGVTRAGFSVREELPILLLIFLLPAGAARVVRWKLL